MSNKDIAIKVDELGKSFKRYNRVGGLKGALKSFVSRDYIEIKAVNSLSFEVAQGEIVGFIGSNGAGKTTTLKMLAGLMNPSFGSAEVLGYEPWKRDREYLKQISLVMGQKFQLWWDLPAIDSFQLTKEIYEIPTDIYKKRLDGLIDLLDISDIVNTQVRKLSLGQRMKCELLASLLHSPKVVFLDEPTIGLDVIMQKRIRQFLLEYNEEYNASIMLTSHYMDDVKELCDRIVIIHQGSIIYDGSVADLTKKYAKEKEISFILGKKALKNDVSKLGTLSDFDGLSGSLVVKREDISEVSSNLLKNFKVVDLDINEIALDEIVRRIFE